MKSFSKAQPKRVVLATDPFTFNHDLANQVARGLRTFFGPALPLVRGVFVLTPNATSIPLSWFDDVAMDVAERAEHKLKEILGLGNFPAAAPMVLIQKNGTSLDIARRIDAFALSDNAEMIIIPTSRRRPMERFLFGSLSESMFREPGLPLLTIAPGYEAGAYSRRTCLLAANYLAEGTQPFVDTFLSMAQRYRVGIIFLHVGKRKILGRAQKDFHYCDAHAFVQPTFAKDEGRVVEIMRNLVTQAEKEGCHAIGRLCWSSLSESRMILHAAAREKVDLIAVPADIASPADESKLGWNRNALRASPYPVWIYRVRNESMCPHVMDLLPYLHGPRPAEHKPVC